MSGRESNADAQSNHSAMVIDEEESNFENGEGDTSRHSSPREKLDIPKEN